MSSPTAPVPRYEPPAQTVHAPLPFNPYDIAETKPKTTGARTQAATAPPPPPAQPKPTGGSFSSPFGEEEGPVTSNSSSVE